MSIIEKMPNWLRYILAIPFGILCLIIVYYIGYFSNRLIASRDSWLIVIYNFLYANGINVIVMVTGMNCMLPKYQFGFTLTIAIIFCSLGMMGLGIGLITATVSVLDIIGVLLTLLAFIYACETTYKEEQQNKKSYNNSEKSYE